MWITAFCLRFLKLFSGIFRVKSSLGCHYFKQSVFKKYLCETCLPQFPLCFSEKQWWNIDLLWCFVHAFCTVCHNRALTLCLNLWLGNGSVSLSNYVIVWNFQTGQGFTIHHFMKYHSHYMIINSPQHIFDKIADIFYICN